MVELVKRLENKRQTPSLYLIYGYREIEETNRWYVGSCLYIREQARDDEHRRYFGHGKKFHEELLKIANGRCFDELVQKVVLEVLWGTPQSCIDRENIHIIRLDSIQNGFNSCIAGGWNGSQKGISNHKVAEKLRGRKQTKESNKKRSDKMKGRVVLQSTREKLRNRVISQRWRDNLSISVKAYWKKRRQAGIQKEELPWW